MIKELLKQLIFSLQIFWVLPLILPFLVSTEKTIIRLDVQRWQQLLNLPSRTIFLQLLVLLQSAPEFRNLYYFRLFKGNFAGRLGMMICKVIYRPCPSLFLDYSCNIGAGLFIQHGFSTIIMADLGKNCWVNQQVTIGHQDRTGRPRLGDNVRVTAGAKVLGAIAVGDNVTIGANAVVVKDVPSDCVVVGIPAYIIERNGIKVREPLI
jgi:serine O-acetyltransferase